MPAVALVRVGFWSVLVQLPGPDQLYVLMPPGPPYSSMVAPSHTGELEEALATGLMFTVTGVLTGSLTQLPLVTVRV